MKRIRYMTFHRPISKEDLKKANQKINMAYKKGEKVEIEWKINTA